MSDPAALRLPNLVIVGVGKAGTTSLFHYLRQHPDICGSDIKELRFLNPLRRGEPLAPLARFLRVMRLMIPPEPLAPNAADGLVMTSTRSY